MLIDIVSPKTVKILEVMAEMNLIVIQDTPKSGFKAVLGTLRSKAKSAPTPDKISKEVELARLYAIIKT